MIQLVPNKTAAGFTKTSSGQVRHIDTVQMITRRRLCFAFGKFNSIKTNRVIEVFLPTFLAVGSVSYLVGMVLTARFVAPRQPFTAPLLGCCAGRCCGRCFGKGKLRCWFVLCCPCLQCVRLSVLLRGNCFGCALVALSVCCAPCAVVLCQLCSSCGGMWMRCRLRQRLQIKG
jgi:hypothetical protein|eukprot:COSAG06_NODE_353_length_16899_cov_14.694345_1_plen_173_part_00